ncbi:hypothetical protein CC85DRAFT_289362 [Cutaneotrichosporon oleaginosum]|uniref:GILT-domain-containing protein n=1 Tax=Cutaneotrichosporon oleaginosum TaxID=879819 RepID=A0A0J1ATH4_9TREE|nr:uncharacterized protein CC85DRAFT_289362 [Cutaneotrichosporon oleaginosum]KLT38614.1 hypothetical protein CC85DRAFT_289362 [Cutaneotrichosporon oleaginosum]TXT05813.1 hypothetical protein COLE_07133 [Cutaneotrichosporon oleaginosum]
MLAAFLLLAAGASALVHQSPLIDDAPRVNVSLFVMSRCPDARVCENVFEEVLKLDHILSKVHLEVDYLGHIDKNAPYGVECMHGDLECAGNAHQLCVRAHAPLDKFYATLSCMNYGNFPGSIGTVALTKRCATTAGIDWWRSGVGSCIEGKDAEKAGRLAEREAWLTGTEIELPSLPDLDELDEWAEAADLDHLDEEGQKRLRDSVKHTIKEGVTKSCTIRIASTLKHAPRECVVDGGVWKGCDDGHAASDFARVIRQEWDNLQK